MDQQNNTATLFSLTETEVNAESNGETRLVCAV
jgi:hypothetical protein